MTIYKNVGVSWRGHKLIVTKIVSLIKENIRNDPYWKIAYYLANGWQPISHVDDEGWWDFFKMLEFIANKIREIDEKQSYFKNIIP